MLSGAIIPLAMVETTSPPAINAPALSKTAAITIAPNMVSAFAPTAGPILLATSLAPILSAIYAPKIAAIITNKLWLLVSTNAEVYSPVTTIKSNPSKGPNMPWPSELAAVPKLENRPISR